MIDKKMNMDYYRPEIVHNYETSVHEAFLRSLSYCNEETGGLDNSLFVQCIKAAGVNFNSTYEQFISYKQRSQQASNAGMRD